MRKTIQYINHPRLGKASRKAWQIATTLDLISDGMAPQVAAEMARKMAAKMFDESGLN